MKRVFGTVEAVFDLLYLAAAFCIGLALAYAGAGNPARLLAGVMALVLACGDAFHLVPRTIAAVTRQEERLRGALGRGKQITSITMTVFYVLLWHVGLMLFQPPNGARWSCPVYLLAAARILLCLLPQNRWQDRFPLVNWAIWRNIPFFLLGGAVCALFWLYRSAAPGLEFAWLAIALSFLFYLPVVLFSNRFPAIGMLMLPKTCVYLWLLIMCLSL